MTNRVCGAGTRARALFLLLLPTTPAHCDSAPNFDRSSSCRLQFRETTWAAIQGEHGLPIQGEGASVRGWSSAL